MKVHCYLTIVKDSIVVESSYDEEFINGLKTQIPKADRAWDPDQKQWTVAAKYLDTIKELACKYYGSVWLLEGGIVTDLKSGVTMSPMDFGEG